ncbi:hypothetical protein FQA39_LY17477 [Lamprigera yunnana]|nr:hypothetical protein FQA39_LY17477 [Lamprigera yunnana]
MESSIDVHSNAEEDETFQVTDGNNVVYAQEVRDTVFVQDGQLLIPFTGHTVMLQDHQGNYQQYIINDSDLLNPEDVSVSDLQFTGEVESETEPSIIYYTGNYSSQSEDNTMFTEDSEDNSPEIKLENYKEDGVVNDARLTIGDELQLPMYTLYENGKFNLQTLNEDPQLLSKNGEFQLQIDTLQQSLSLDETVRSGDLLDFNKITGKNLITGQVVTLDGYFDKLQKRLNTSSENALHSTRRKFSKLSELINKKMTIRKMEGGKKIVGKILHVQTNDNFKIDTSAQPKRVESKDAKVASRPQIIIKKQIVTRKNFDANVGKTLAGLMDLESVQHKLQNKNLIVKLIDKVYQFGTNQVNKTVSYVYGHMELMQDSIPKWQFILQNGTDTGDDDTDQLFVTDTMSNNSSIDTKIKRTQDGGMDFSEIAFLTMITVKDPNGRRSTKVNVNSQQDCNVCQLCNKVFRTSSQMRKHFINIHFSEKWICCEICGKLVANKSVLQRHKRIHTEEKWFLCSKCPKSFNTSGNLKRHITVHDQSLRPLECSVCTQRFTDESSLRKHLLIHTGIRAYTCEQCNRGFRNQGDLNYHKRIHDPIKQYSCDVCGRAFSRHSNLVRHIEVHRGSGALHQCNICGCSYSFASSLTRHIVQKHIGAKQNQQE